MPRGDLADNAGSFGLPLDPSQRTKTDWPISREFQNAPESVSGLRALTQVYAGTKSMSADDFAEAVAWVVGLPGTSTSVVSK